MGTRPALERFWNRVKKTEGCWLWTGTKDRNGYGYFNINKKRTWVHRYSWLIHHGEIPGALCVCHHCDTRLCVHPDHLFVGTHLDNSRDMVNKGRSAKGDRNGSRVHIDRMPRGETHYRAKLTDDQVREIRQSARDGLSGKYLAEHYGVSRGLISMILSRKRWGHVSTLKD